jgi:hypothetical protein
LPCRSIFLYLFTIIKSGEEYISWRFWAPNFSYHIPVSPFSVQVFLALNFRTTSVYVSHLMRDIKFYTFRKQEAKLQTCILIQSNPLITSWKWLNILCRYKRVSL